MSFFPPFQLFREHHDKHKQPHIDTREIICCVPWHFSVNDTCCKLSQPSWMVQTTENRMKIKYLSTERKLYAKPVMIQISVSVFGGTFRGHFHLFWFFFISFSLYLTLFNPNVLNCFDIKSIKLGASSFDKN